MRGLRLDTNRVEELIDELYGKNKRLSFLEGSFIRLAAKNKIRRDKFLALYTGHEIEKNFLRKLSLNKDKEIQLMPTNSPRIFSDFFKFLFIFDILPI